MDNIPSFKPQKVNFRSTIKSTDFNDMQESVLFDILNLFNKANELNTQLDETKDIVFTDNQYLKNKINSLETKLATVTQLYKNLNNNDSIKKHIIYPTSFYTDPNRTIAAYIDNYTLDVTLPFISKLSKVNLYDNLVNKVFIPESLIVENSINLDSANIISIEENDIKNAFNGNNTSFWRKKVTTDISINEVICEILIGLPDDIISNREINSIILSLYPYSTLDLVNIEYKLFGNWTQIPGFVNHNDGTLENFNDIFGNVTVEPIIPNVGDIKFCFNDISAKEIKITLRQKNYREQDGQRVFDIGAREIEIVNFKYDNNVATFYTKVEFLGNSTKEICDIVSILNNTNQIDTNVIKYELFRLDDNDKPIKITTGFPFDIYNNKMLIKCDIYKNRTSPALNQLNIIYKEKQ